tara:strand:+ start:1933 stop:2151 length:219 start_codon:yes stop_codon:yes gene_type:complete
MYSILLQVFEKIRKKEIEKTLNPGKKKEFAHTLKPYEAMYLENHIRNHMDEYQTKERTHLLEVANYINQKLA